MSGAAASLMAALAVELDDVRTGVDRISLLVSELVGRLPVQDRAKVLTDAQAADALTQRLDAVAGVLHGLSDGESTGDALSRVLLADLVARLRAHVDADSVPHTPVTSGDLLLFD